MSVLRRKETYEVLVEWVEIRDRLFRKALSLRPELHAPGLGEKPPEMVERHREEHREYLLARVEDLDSRIGLALDGAYEALKGTEAKSRIDAAVVRANRRSMLTVPEEDV